MIPELPTRLPFITCIMELVPRLTLWDGRSPGPVLPLSVLTLPMVASIYSFLAVKPRFLWGLGRKLVLVPGLSFPIPSSMSMVSLPVFRFSAQKHLTTDLGERRSSEPLMTRSFPFRLLSVNSGIVPRFTQARGRKRFLWWMMLLQFFQVLLWRFWFLLSLLHSLFLTLESIRLWEARTQLPCPPWPWLVWAEVEECEK